MGERWLVVGPMRLCGGGEFEPPEYGVSAWYETEAQDRAEALRLALHKDRSVADLAVEARGDGRHPYAYIRAVRFGTRGEDCPECRPAEADDDDDGYMCPPCSLAERNATSAINALTQRYNADWPDTAGKETEA